MAQLYVTDVRGLQGAGLGAVPAQPFAALGGRGLAAPGDELSWADEMRLVYGNSPGSLWLAGFGAAMYAGLAGGVTGLVASSRWRGAARGAMWGAGGASLTYGVVGLMAGLSTPGTTFLLLGLGLAGFAVYQAFEGAPAKSRGPLDIRRSRYGSKYA